MTAPGLPLPLPSKNFRFMLQVFREKKGVLSHFKNLKNLKELKNLKDLKMSLLKQLITYTQSYSDQGTSFTLHPGSILICIHAESVSSVSLITWQDYIFLLSLTQSFDKEG